MRDGRDEQEKREMQDSRIVEWRILCLLRVAHFSPILLVPLGFPVPPLSPFALLPLFSLMSPPTLQRFNQGPNHSTELLDALSEFTGLLSVKVSDFFRKDHLGQYLIS
jgi:hypothetical protein